jgi:hypothetical protein
LLDATLDREKILRAIEGRQFQKVFHNSRMAAGSFDLSAFRERIDRVRADCDGGDNKCEEEKSYLPNEAKQLASGETPTENSEPSP